MITEVEHSVLGMTKTLGLPIRLSETPASVATGAPVLGEHTQEVLSDLGYSDEKISQLADEGAIFVNPPTK